MLPGNGPPLGAVHRNTRGMRMHNNDVTTQGPFLLPPPSGAPFRNVLYAALKRPLQKVLCLDRLNAMYLASSAKAPQGESPTQFLDRALAELGVDCTTPGADMSNIPVSGPLMVVSNHPFGVVEGLALARAVAQVRPDVKILANHLLAAIPEMRPLLIELDPFGGAGSTGRNVAGLRAALAWLKRGGALIAFPAGEVSSLAVGRRMVADPPWQSGMAALARRMAAPVLPAFFHGRNSNWFQAAGLVHPRLRTLLLPRENLKRRGQTLRLSLGSLIPAARLADMTDQEASAYLRFRCHLLRGRRQEGAAAAPVPVQQQAHQPLAAQGPLQARLDEIAALPEGRILARSEPFVVFQATAPEIPALLHEVARLRESTFRRVGEGTGQALDMDRYDAHYRHLILWNERDREVAGAYRFAGTDEVLAEHGAAGLYTASQFRIKPAFWEHLNPALELGRSFVRPRYQKSYQPLLLLWKGLAEYVARHPWYRVLFGCVSISGDYSPLSRELMMAFLRRHSTAPELARLVRPTRRPKVAALPKLDLRVPEGVFRDPSDMDALVAEVEGGRGIPVLLRQYLKLGGRIAAFNLDPDFGHCLDGLISVDLAATDQRTLGRFMGAEAARRFLACHAGAGPSGDRGAGLEHGPSPLGGDSRRAA